MNAGGLFEAHKNEDCETHAANIIKGEIQKLWDRTVAHIKAAMEARKFDPGPPYEPDYEKELREREGQYEILSEQIRQIARDHEPGIRINGSHNEGGDKSWKDWVLGLVGLAILAWLARLSVQMDTIQEVAAEQRMLKEHQQMTDKHLEATDSHVDRIETRVYRGNQ